MAPSAARGGQRFFGPQNLWAADSSSGPVELLQQAGVEPVGVVLLISPVPGWSGLLATWSTRELKRPSLAHAASKPRLQATRATPRLWAADRRRFKMSLVYL